MCICTYVYEQMEMVCIYVCENLNKKYKKNGMCVYVFRLLCQVLRPISKYDAGQCADNSRGQCANGGDGSGLISLFIVMLNEGVV